MDQGELVWAPKGSCLDSSPDYFKVSSAASFTHDHNLTVIQTIENTDNKDRSGWNPNVFGEIVLRAGMGSSPGRIDLEVITNDKDLHINIEFDKDTQAYKMITPRNIDWGYTGGAPCIQIRATVWVPADSFVEVLKVNAVHLDIVVMEGLLMGAVDGSHFASIIGDITTPKPKSGDGEGVVPYTLGSRDIVVETISGDVKGWFPLYDLLKISTTSGDIAVDVAPKAVDHDKPKSAVLDIQAISGKIQVHEPISQAIKSAKPDKKFPPREYVVNLGTSAGDIVAEVAFSSRADIQSRSGDLDVQLWPVLDSGLLKATRAPKPVINTSTASGDTRLTLLDPLWTSVAAVGRGPDAPLEPFEPFEPPEEDKPTRDTGDEWTPIGDDDPYVIIHPHNDLLSPLSEDPAEDDAADDSDVQALDNPGLNCLKSEHSTVSGNIKLGYPSSWEGELVATTISGSQKVRGQDLEVYGGGGPGGFMRTTHGNKGRHGSSMKIESVSGDQDVLVGKEPTEKQR